MNAKPCGTHDLPARTITAAQDVRVGDDVHTAAGWQTVTALFADARRCEVAIYTTHEDEPAIRVRLHGQVAIRRATAAVSECPPWCVEHYTAVDRTRVHSGAPRAVTGASVEDDGPVMVSVWTELRGDLDTDREAVGVLEKKTTSDLELCPCDLRALARHLVEVAEQVEAARAAGGDGS